MEQAKARGAIFDVDGTLLDSMWIWQDIGERYLERLGIIETEAATQDFLHMSLEEGAAYLKERYQLPQSCAQIRTEVLDIVKDFYFYEAQPKAGAVDLVKRMAQAGIPMVIATSSDRTQVCAALARLGLEPYFRAVLTSSEFGSGKSQPFIYREAARILGTAPAETAVFEDALHAVRTAKQDGFFVVGVYDRASENRQPEIRKWCDLYLESLENFTISSVFE